MSLSSLFHSLDILFDVLLDHPDGLSEYDLIKKLTKKQHVQFQDLSLSDNLTLFQTHFILFNGLYVLQQKLVKQQRYYLSISPIKIHLMPYVKASRSALTEHDPLRDYYIDFSNLGSTTGADVARLLADFWARLTSTEQREQALDILGLEGPVDYSAIKRQHRRLAMQHHPDRGGDKERLQAINEAMVCLAREYGKKH